MAVRWWLLQELMLHHMNPDLVLWWLLQELMLHRMNPELL